MEDNWSEVLGCASPLNGQHHNCELNVMPIDLTPADPAPVLELLIAFRRSKTMFCAVKLGIFDLLREDLPVRIEFMSREEMERRLPYVPDYLPPDRPARVVFIGDDGIPCGGTHVKSAAEIGGLTIRKMKVSGGALRVSYQVA